ncbi:MAG: hypothetical protein AAF492_25820, partial [Verrucomicrobiota bacterium]
NLVEKIAHLARQPAPPTKKGPASNEKWDRVHAVRDHLSFAIMDAEESEEDDERAGKPKQVIKQGLSEYFLFAIDGRETIRIAEPKRLVSMAVTNVPLETMYKLSDRSQPNHFTKYYRFKNESLGDDVPAMENLGLSPLPDGEVRLFSEYANKDLAYVGGASVKYIPVGDRVDVNVGLDQDITMKRRLKDRFITDVKSRQYKRRLDNRYVWYYDLIDYDETFVWEEEVVSGKPVLAKTEVERRFEDHIVLWGNGPKPDDWEADRAGAYVDLHTHTGIIEKVDANHVKYFLDLKPGEKQTVTYTVTYKRRKVGPEIHGEKKREPI